MKSFLFYLFVIPGFFLLSACTDDDTQPEFIGTPYKPVLMERADLEKSISFVKDRNLKNAGKIYSYGSYILINERFEGVHFFDNADPRNPLKVGFVRIPGCIDMAVKNNVLYADNAVDLVAIDISNFPEISQTERIRGIFPELTPPGMEVIPSRYSIDRRPENTVIVKWINE